EKFQSRLKQLGHAHEVLQLPDSTRTAQEAAEAIGCNVEQIAKSIIFRLKNANEAILIIASGKNRVNENMVEILAGDELAKADADFVKKMTGYAMRPLKKSKKTRFQNYVGILSFFSYN